MNLEVFCYLGLLKLPEQLESFLALLAEGERAEPADFPAAIQHLSRTELLQRWAKLREDEWRAMLRHGHERTGIWIDALPPSLHEGWLSWLLDQR